jgi:protein-S-isoprenylcysteine O-methyltransferase Ste14
MGKPGAVVSSLGLVLSVAGWWILSLALRENPFAATVVKLQLVEEQFLRRGLKGYNTYTERVRYRLIPFLW